MMLLAPQVPALGQEYGQWSWDAVVETGQRRYESRFDGSDPWMNRETQLRIGAGLNGFVVHPTIARFRLDLDLQATRVADGLDVDGSRVGFGAEAGFSERGGFPFRLYFRRQTYDYDQAFADDPFALRAALDTGDSWGGSLRIRRGPLDGTLLGFDGIRINYLDPGARREASDRQFLDWTRGGRGFEHHLRVERRAREFGVVDLEQDNVNVNLEERAQLTESWRWELTGIGALYESTLGVQPPQDINDYRLRNRVSGKVRGRDLLDVVHASSLLDPEGSPAQSGQDGLVAYRWRPIGGWEVAPEVGYATVRSDGFRTRAERAGLSLTWQAGRETLEILFSTRGAYGFEHRRSTMVEDDTRWSYGVNGSVGVGAVSVLRSELEFEAGRNELRIERDSVPGLPGLGLTPAGIGTEDHYRARAGLKHEWDSTGIYGWGEWSRRTAAGQVTIPGGRYGSSGVSGAVEFHAHRVTTMASAGMADVSDAIQGDQRLAYAGANASCQWGRLLSFRAGYRADERKIALFPDVTGRRAEAGVLIRLGLHSLGVDAYEARDRIEDEPERVSRGFRWTLSTRFAGWLPIVSGIPRRGVIR